MSSAFIEVIGITPAARFPKCPSDHPYAQLCEIDKLCIPDPNPDIHDVLEVCLTVVICSFKIIHTPVGNKAVIDGKKQIKVTFVANDHCQSVHTAQFEVPFCTFILLGRINKKIAQICSAVEDITVKCPTNRCVTTASIIFSCPLFQTEADCAPDPATGNDDCQVNNGGCPTQGYYEE